MPDSFQLILIAVLIVLTGALGYALFMLFRWKVAFDGKEIVAFPSDSLDDLYSRLSSLSEHISKSAAVVGAASKESTDGHSKVFERVQALLKAVSETRSEYRTLRDELDEKSNELQRYKKGYDLRLTCKAIRPLLASHVLVRQELERGNLSNDHRRFVELLDDNYSDLLDDFDVRVESPTAGSSFRDAVGVKSRPETVPAQSQEQVGTIQAVKSPCYILNYDGNDVVVREARVVVFAEQGTS